ncbi:Clp protease N-terminal domain-containing protein [Gordonia rhizosphera]|uniref:Clp protease N-terminal domain-containing protein n=1 Tax=Gordonia rhizosphera TaxID=83341 RepID=UPI0012F65EE2|nr:Clp protease N-terminal domain-containing protein [Gordonia rhizosphera]
MARAVNEVTRGDDDVHDITEYRQFRVTADHLGEIARGLVTAPESLADLTLRALGTDLASPAAAAVESSSPPGTETDAGRSVVPYDDRSRSVLEATVATAVEMGHDFIGTEHLLLALFTDPAMSETLSSLHVDAAGARSHVVELLAESRH